MAKERAKVAIAQYPDEPTEVRAIDGEYIRAYLSDNYKKGNISRAELENWQKLTNELIAAHGERAYFMPLRSEFVKAFFPALSSGKKKKPKTESISDFFENLLSEGE